MTGGHEDAEHARAAAEMATQLVDVVYALEIDPNPGFTYVSPSETALVGYTPEEHYADPGLGMRLLDPRDREVLASTAAAPEGKPFSFTVRWIARDGRLLWTEHRCTRVTQPDGRTMLFGAARDVTDQVLARQALEAEHERYRLLAESTRDVVLRTDAEGRVA